MTKILYKKFHLSLNYDKLIVLLLYDKDFEFCNISEHFIFSDAVLVSYLDGQIHILKLDTEDITKEPTWSCVYGESDLMKVSALCVLHKVKVHV
jgi:hypothetical protein